jgi:DNA-directed RNA polymerase specialized sigma24 family protein
MPNDQDPAPSPDLARAAFREVHARRLHGFAQLLVLGDRALAARLAAEALASGAQRLDVLRHPERAAAWLRQHVVDHAGRAAAAGGAQAVDRHVLGELGADDGVVAGLALLGRRERAALIASAIERLDRRDVATIVGRDGGPLDRLLRKARQRYLAGYTAVAREPVGDGPLTARIRDVAQRTLT